MQRVFYKHFISITSQLAFCSTPLRLDAYKDCGFGCGYCFAMTRQGHGRNLSLQIASPKALDSRLKRIHDGVLNSALDEFLDRRIPLQFGGMSDPFAPAEKKRCVAYDLIRVLRDHNYPTIFSTKSSLIGTKIYRKLLKGGNFYVRFSTTVVSPRLRSAIDKGTPTNGSILQAAEALASIEIPVSLRFQPIFPGHEHHGMKLVERAYNSGVKHISAEYLKVPIDANIKFSAPVKSALNENPISEYIRMEASLNGREYILPRNLRSQELKHMADHTRRIGMTFGYADNDLLLHSDGNSCCGAADLYLKDANFFSANVVGEAKARKLGEFVSCSQALKAWYPKSRITPYLNSTARIDSSPRDSPDWPIYLKTIWQKEFGIYGPEFYSGLTPTGRRDSLDTEIFVRTQTHLD
jgi:DNA repair photolyase